MITGNDTFDTAKVFKVVLRILDNWQASTEESMSLLGFKSDEFKATCQAVKSDKPVILGEKRFCV